MGKHVIKREKEVLDIYFNVQNRVQYVGSMEHGVRS